MLADKTYSFIELYLKEEFKMLELIVAITVGVLFGTLLSGVVALVLMSNKKVMKLYMKWIYKIAFDVTKELEDELF